MLYALEAVGLSHVYIRALQDVVAVLESVALACGSTESLDEARSMAKLLLDGLREGNVDKQRLPAAIERLAELIEDAREELEAEGCLEAYRLDDALAALESVKTLA